jgi:hypothetical protein
MKIKNLLLLLLLVVTTSCTIRAQGEFGLDIGQPINPTTGAINLNTDTLVIGNTCTPWVRLNFILGPWSSPDDTTLHNGRTWQQTYGEIITSIRQKGIQIYGLIGGEAVYQPLGGLLEYYPSTDPANATAWIDEYKYNFVKIVDYFKADIQVFESFNEPNNWANSNTAVIDPQWFAYILQELYLEVKYNNGHWTDPAWQVTLVSGALFTFDGNTGGSYINDTYWYGKNVFAWDWIYQQTGSYPLDGFGMHLYVEQGSSNPTLVTNALNINLNDFWNNIYLYETDPNKKIWISEIGWETGTHGEQFQADNLNTSYNVLTSDARVALTIWFTLSDWPGASWGVYYFGNLQVSDRKQAYYDFRALYNCNILPGTLQITSMPACSDTNYAVSFSWDETGPGWFLDISTDPNFNIFYNKSVSLQTSETAPAGFCDYPNCTQPLALQPNTTYYWRVWNGVTHTPGASFIVPGCTTTSINSDESSGSNTTLHYNIETGAYELTYVLSKPQHVKIDVYTMLGQKKSLSSIQQPEGKHVINIQRNELPKANGVYILNLITGQEQSTLKVVAY